MKKIDWNTITETDGGFERPIPGAYIARIEQVEDHEDKEYLKVYWDFAEGSLKGDNARTYDRAGFWPMTSIRSYKPSALGFFKSFKTAVEKSNRGYVFDESNLDGMNGKLVGVILGEEEYLKRDGTVGTSLKVQEFRSVDAIRKGDYKIPDIRKLKNRPAPAPAPAADNTWANYESQPDGDLPF